MSRILNIQLELTDDEVQAFIQRFSGNSQSPVTASFVGGTPAPTADDDNGPVNANAPTLDVNGTPWIEAVHAGTKGQNADGSWKRRKGVDEAKMKAAEAAARGAMQPQTPTFTVPASIAGGAPVNLPNPNFPGIPAPAGFPGFPPVQPAAPVDVPVSYEDISNKFAALGAAGKVPDQAALTAMYGRLGITDMNQLISDETLRGRLMKELSNFG